jgi:hypothetical protein
MARPLSAEQEDAQGTLTHLLLDAGLEDLAEQIAKVTRPSIGLTTRKAVRADLAVGASRLGGEPDLPPGSPWPSADGVALPFLAQIRLEDVAEHNPNGLLPPSGLLSFFASGLKGRVLLEPDVSTLQRRELPDEIDEADRSFAWGFVIRGEVSIPPSTSPLAIDADGYHDLAYQLSDALEHGFDTHQMLGYLDDPDHPVQLPGLELLLAISSDEHARYFYLDRAHLLARDFSQVLIAVGV